MNDGGNEPLLEGPGSGPWRFDVPGPPPGLRERLLERTAAAVRGRARRRKLRLAAGMVAVYAAGLATVAPLLLERPGPPERAVEQRSPPAAPPAPLDPEEIRRRVPDAPPPERAGLLQLAGDLFLQERGDPAAALECYRQVLELASPPVLTPEPRDSWLLIALKQASRSEKGLLR